MTPRIPNKTDKPIIALLTNHDDDIYCFRKELIEAFAEAGYGILISCPYGEKLELMQHISYIYDDPPIDRRSTNPVADLKLYRHYHKLFSEYRPAVVLTYTAKPNVYAGIAAWRLGIPYICNVTGLGSVLKLPSFVRAFILRLFRFSYRRAACVMFQNDTNMKLAEENRMIRGKHRLIPGSGVNTERYPLQPYPAGGDGIHGKPVIFNYIGRIMHEKGVDDYIEAARRIRADYPNTEFRLAGFIEPTESHYEADLKQLGEAGVIRYVGNLKDVKPYIAEAHALIHPSVYGEGMSNVLLESASSGRFLITTDNPGCRETVVEGETGFLYPGGDADALTAAIKRFLAMDNEKRRKMGEAGRQHVKNGFERRFVVDAYKEEIASLVKK